MDRLTAEDRLMLWPDQLWPQEIGALAILDSSRLLDPGCRPRIEAVRQAVEARLPLVPRFRPLLRVPRRGLGGPLWIDAPAFDLADHVRVAALPAPGAEAALLQVTEQLRSRRSDRSRPLWEMWFLPGLPDNRVGLVVKLHHAIADGIAELRTPPSPATHVEVGTGHEHTPGTTSSTHRRFLHVLTPRCRAPSPESSGLASGYLSSRSS